MKYFCQSWGTWDSDGNSITRVNVRKSRPEDFERELEAGEYFSDELPQNIGNQVVQYSEEIQKELGL